MKTDTQLCLLHSSHIKEMFENQLKKYKSDDDALSRCMCELSLIGSFCIQ